MMKKTVVFLCVAGVLLGCAHARAQQADSGPAPDPQQVQAMRQLLSEHPELVLDVLEEHKVQLLEMVEQGAKQRSELERAKQREADLANPQKATINESRPIFGNPDADVTILEYTDFLCPYCGRADAVVDRILKERDDVRVQLKHLPFHEASMAPAVAYEAIAMQDAAAAKRFKELAFARQRQLGEDPEATIQGIVADLNIDTERFAKDRADPRIQEWISADMTEAEGLGFNGTPMFLINGVALRGAYPEKDFLEIIEQVQERGIEFTEPEPGETCEDCLNN